MNKVIKKIFSKYVEPCAVHVPFFGETAFYAAKSGEHMGVPTRGGNIYIGNYNKKLRMFVALHELKHKRDYQRFGADCLEGDDKNIVKREMRAQKFSL